MTRPLQDNDRVSYVVAKPFTTNGKDYRVGDDFPREDARDIQTMVRARFVIPVVEDSSDKPRYFHREIRPKQEVLDRLRHATVQIVMPQAPDSVDLEPLTYPERTPEPTQETPSAEPGVGEEAPSDQPAEPAFDPAEHTVSEVRDYLAEHPEEKDRVLAEEAEGRGRKGLLEES